MLLRVLGQLSLQTMGGFAVDSILKRPKVLALLVYLTIAGPRAYRRRDELLALFWPEYGSARARHALRQTCYVLRKALPDVVVGRGAEELGIVRETLWCDAVALEHAFRNRQFREVCELHGGDFANGLHITDVAPEFDYWMSTERDRLRHMAVESAWHLANEALTSEDEEAASRWASHAIDVSPFDEVSLQRQIRILDHIGDRSGALRAYQRFAVRIRAELDTEPSPETQSLLAAVKGRRYAGAHPRVAGHMSAVGPNGGTHIGRETTQAVHT
jgi:DNA-binding SARP family transcriptional activator